MTLTQATPADFEQACRLYSAVCTSMEDSGLHQWHWGDYPSEDVVRQDITAGDLYLLREDDRIVCAVCVNRLQDDEYEALAWQCGTKPGLFHRLAVAPACQGRRLGTRTLDAVEDLLRTMGCDSLRCDTYSENLRARQMYLRRGMRIAGEVHFPGKELPFICFEKTL